MASRLYNRGFWQRMRRQQLAQFPLCQWCEARGEIVPASVVHHVEQHRGDINKFRLSDLVSLCKPCHDGDAQQREVAGFSRRIGTDGWPTDVANHPVYRTGAR